MKPLRRGPRWVAVALGLSTAAVVGSAVVAQYRGSWEPDRGGVPEWEVDPEFRHDVFTFVRVRYGSWRGGWGRGRGGGGGWRTDWPDSDLNFSFRLQQLTSLKVDPEPETPPAG